MRAFVGLPLPDNVVTALEKVQSGLEVGRRVAAENLHLTLTFLDDQPETVLAALHEELSGIAGAQPALKITGLDVLGGRKPRLLFAAVAPDPALTRLRGRIRGAARTVGIELPRERFRPHITLARFSHRLERGGDEKLQAYLSREGGVSITTFNVDQFALYRSRLHPSGAQYDILAEYPLN